MKHCGTCIHENVRSDREPCKSCLRTDAFGNGLAGYKEIKYGRSAGKREQGMGSCAVERAPDLGAASMASQRVGRGDWHLGGAGYRAGVAVVIPTRKIDHYSVPIFTPYSRNPWEVLRTRPKVTPDWLYYASENCLTYDELRCHMGVL